MVTLSKLFNEFLVLSTCVLCQGGVAAHMGMSNISRKRLKNVKQFAISDHVLVFTDYNKFKLLLTESLLIKSGKFSFKHDRFHWNSLIKMTVLCTVSYNYQISLQYCSNFIVCTETIRICYKMLS